MVFLPLIFLLISIIFCFTSDQSVVTRYKHLCASTLLYVLFLLFTTLGSTTNLLICSSSLCTCVFVLCMRLYLFLLLVLLLLLISFSFLKNKTKK